MVDEDGVFVVYARAFRIGVERDAADRVEVTMGVLVLHVGEHFENKHATVTVESNFHRLCDGGIGQDRFETEARIENELLLLLSRRKRHHGWLGRKVGPCERIPNAGTAPTARWWVGGCSLSLLRLRACLGNPQCNGSRREGNSGSVNQP